jgi:hypothetical protein
VLGGDRRQAVPGRRRGSALATGRACRGLVRVSGCGQAVVAAGVVSVGQCSVAIGWQAVPGRRRGSALAASRACRGLVRVSGCWPWCSVTGSSSGSSFSRLMKPAERRRRRQRRAVLGDDRRQAVPGRRRGSALATGRACRGLVRVSGCWQTAVAVVWSVLAVLDGDRPASGARSKARQRTGGRSGLPWPGQDLGLRAARRASGGAWWRSPASGARPKTRQRTGGRSGLPWPGQDLGLRAGSGCRWRGQCRAVLGGDRLASGARPKTRQRTGNRSGLPCLVRVSGCWPWCSVTGSSSGSSFSRLVKPAERRRRRQCRAVLGGDRLASGAQVEREAAHWRLVGLAVVWSGCRVAGRGAQLPAVRPGLRSLDW